MVTRAVLIVALAIHSALSAYAIANHGYLGAFPPFADVWIYQIFSDLSVSIGLLWLLLFQESRRKGRPLWRIVLCGVGIIFSGSIAPLIYLLVHKDVLE